ncbi:MAG TPA: SAM-dependent methyltransferase [Streptosporangiaceae bacterium]|jgi:methyltransferase (TIGR00027 family)|nr:SAM-dependent methyltransferase [Streptosporangiaceae bacterium]
MENEGQPSQTAMTAAAARAAHLLVDSEPRIFADSLAALLLGDKAETYLRYHREHGDHPLLAGTRAQATCRSRFTEDQLALAAARGTAQYVILGAGLDSFACRSELAGRLRVFEVDHPATQQRKRALLAAAGLAEPLTLTWVPVDFETDELIASLTAAGLDPAAPAFVSWLGVTMYLTAEAIGATLASLSRLAPGSELVTDYMLTADLRDADGVAYADLVMPDSERRGEPWLSFFTPEQMTGLLTRHGFTGVRDVRQRDAISATLWERTDLLRPIELSRLCHATVGAGD